MISLKAIHQGLALVSVSGFVVRGLWMGFDSPRLRLRWVRIAPHVIDTLLLATGVWLALQLPLAALSGWLPAKLAALVAYIVLGVLALRPGRPKSVRIACFIAALLAVAYLVSVALTRQPLPGAG